MADHEVLRPRIVRSVHAVSPSAQPQKPFHLERAAQALLRAAPYLRELIKKKVAVKTIPNFTFVYDNTPKKASRIDELLNKLEKEKGQ